MGPASASGKGHTAWQMPGTFEQDARMAIGARMSLLLVGHSDAALDVIQRWLPTPVIGVPGGSGLIIPEPGLAGTLLIQDVDRLGAADQRRLLAWLGVTGRDTQVVSTSADPLLPRVERGEFLEALYYRLNVVCIHVTRGTGGERAASVVDVLPFGFIRIEWPPRP